MQQATKMGKIHQHEKTNNNLRLDDDDDAFTDEVNHIKTYFLVYKDSHVARWF